MADALWSKFPETYIILEHFTANSEETDLANFRVSEGKGMMLWGNFNYAYGQNTMGYVSGSDIAACKPPSVDASILGFHNTCR